MRDAWLRNHFSIPVVETFLNVNTEQMANDIYEHSKNNKGMSKSNEGGYQSDNIKHADTTEFKSFYSQLQEEVNRYVEHVKCPQPDDIFSWYNINAYKDYNQEHLHPGSIVSGVFYVKVPEDSGTFSFIHPAEDYIDMFWNNAKRSDGLFRKNNYKGTRWELEPKEKLLILFPSWLKQYVKPNNNKTEKRISISFNYY